MNIKFLEAQKTTSNSIDVKYSLDGELFTVEWNNIHPANGEIIDFALQVGAQAENAQLAERVDEAIRQGETDDNPDLMLYILIRDTFSHIECNDL